jgi:hypothetical protein
MFDVLSPDGLPIHLGRRYSTLADARAAADAFAMRFAWQGFYATSTRERIPLEEIVGRCRVISLTEEDDDEETA